MKNEQNLGYHQFLLKEVGGEGSLGHIYDTNDQVTCISTYNSLNPTSQDKIRYQKS